jgi:hypothetical protein
VKRRSFSLSALVLLLGVLLLPASVTAKLFAVDGAHPRHFVLKDNEQDPGDPFLRLGKSAFWLLQPGNWDGMMGQSPPASRGRGEIFDDEAWDQGFNTLRVFLMAWWYDTPTPNPTPTPSATPVRTMPQLNPWSDSQHPGDEDGWWDSTGDEFDRLKQLLWYIDCSHPDMVVEVTVLDAGTMERMQYEIGSARAERFLYNPYWPLSNVQGTPYPTPVGYRNEGPEEEADDQDYGLVNGSFATSKLLLALNDAIEGYGNVSIEIGNQISDNWFCGGSEVAPGPNSWHTPPACAPTPTPPALRTSIQQRSFVRSWSGIGDLI